MPRRKNTRPTIIYWLLDTRPEIIAKGWLIGEPFYCGKTVDTTERRLHGHRADAATRPFGKVSARILECGDFVRIETMEIVPPDQDWCERERHWISVIRFSFPDSVNVSDGGSRSPGWVPTAEQIARTVAGTRRGRRARVMRALETLHCRANLPSLSQLLSDV